MNISAYVVIIYLLITAALREEEIMPNEYLCLCGNYLPADNSSAERGGNNAQ